MRLFISGTALLLVSVVCSMGNLLQNPGFEQGSGFTIPGWNVWNETTRIEDWAAHNSAYGLALQGWTTGGGLHQDIQTGGVSNYTFTLEGFRDPDFVATYTVEMKLEFYNSDDALLFTSNKVLQGTIIWQTFRLTAVSTEDTAYLRAVLSFTGPSGSGGAFKIDNTSLTSKTYFEHFVSTTGSDTPPYATWETAASTIDAALAVALPNAHIIVTDGVYQISSQLVITNALELRSVNGADATIIDGQHTTRCIYLSHSNAAIDGFTITNGYVASTTLPNAGGGIYIDQAGTVSNCIITGNAVGSPVITDTTHSMSRGGGVYLNGGGLLQNCIISGNLATGPTNTGYNSTNAFAHGGGLYVTNSGVIESCLIENNRAIGGHALMTTARSKGGGIFAAGPSIIISNTTIRNNRSEGGRTYFGQYGADAYGGGIYLAGATNRFTAVVDCEIYGNAVTGTNGVYGAGDAYGGGIYARDCRIDRCTASNNTLLAGSGDHTSGSSGYARGGGIYCQTNVDVRNSLLVYNHIQGGYCSGAKAGDGEGGGIYVTYSTLRNSTVCDNTALGGTGSEWLYDGLGEGGGVFLTYGGALLNCIMYFNTSQNSPNLNAEGDNYYNTYCCVTPHYGGTGNIGDDPLFLDRPNGDYRLLIGSPCINAGTNIDVFSFTDLAGMKRIAQSTVDLGAYEYDLDTSDSDSDSLPDGDEINTYSSNPLDPDSDDDGMLDGPEAAAGTGVNDANSFLALDTQTPNPWTPTGITVHWQSVAGKQYNLLRTSNLTNDFEIIENNITATPPQNAYTDTTADTATRYYYRIQLAQ